MITNCLLASGSHAGNITDCIRALDLPDPERSWYEPRPGSGLDANGEEIPDLAPALLHPLLKKGCLDPLHRFGVDECRLFWPRGSLYLIDEGSGATRWSFWAAPESTVGADAEAATNAIEDKATDSSTEAGLSLDVGDLLQLQDRERFGLGKGANTEKLELRLLRRGGVLIGWTVTGITGE